MTRRQRLQEARAYGRLVEAKYSAEDRRDMAKNGQALPGGSYPIKDREDLERAIHAVGRGNAGHDTIRDHIIARAKALGLSDMIPDTWTATGALKEAMPPQRHGAYDGTHTHDHMHDGRVHSHAHAHDGDGLHADHAHSDGQTASLNEAAGDVQDNTAERWQPRAAASALPTNVAVASETGLTGTAVDAGGHVDGAARAISNAGTAVDPANTEGGGPGPGTGLPWYRAASPGQSVREAFPGSWREIERRVQDAINADEAQEAPYEQADPTPILALYTDRVVYSDDGHYWECSYTIDDAGTVTLSDAQEVVPTFTTIGTGESDGDMYEADASCCDCCDDGECDDPCDESCCDADSLTEAGAGGPARIIEAVVGAAGREWDVILIRSGLSANGRYYPAKTLRESVQLFDGAACFADHPTDQERAARPERSIRDKVGVFSQAVYESLGRDGSGEEQGQIRARFTVVAPWLREMLVEAVEANRPDFIGFSINGGGLVKQQQRGGRLVGFVESISSIHSVDAVTTPAAGGRIERLVASDPGPGGEIDMTPEEIAALAAQSATAAAQQVLAAAGVGANGTTDTVGATQTVQPAAVLEARQMEPNAADIIEVRREIRKFRAEQALAEVIGSVTLSDLGKQQVKNRMLEWADHRDIEESDIQGLIRETQDHEALILRAHGIGDVQGLGATRDGVNRVRGMTVSHDNYYKALEGMFSGEPIDGVAPFRSLKEAYGRWTGIDSWEIDPYLMLRDFTTATYDSHVDHIRIQESLSTASWSNVYADVFYLRVLKEYQASPYYDMWRKLVSEIEDTPDFYTRHWDRVGGYADLSTVAEQATYPNMTSPTDQAVSYSVSKKGGIDDITFEAIVGDRIGKIRRIPGAMGRAAARTLWKNVAGLATNTNPTLGYDSHSLYDNTNHGNATTTALSLAAMATAIQKMRAQTAFGESSEVLGPRNLPKYLIVNNTLEQLARRIVNPTPGFIVSSTATTDTTFNPDAMAGYNLEVIVYDQLTSSTEWYLLANPAEVDTIIIGFLNGQQQPELFVQDQPNVGSVFTADKVSYKVRHIWGSVVADHRSFLQGNT